MSRWIIDHLWLIPAVPLAASLVILSLSSAQRKSAAALAVAGQIAALAMSVLAFLPTLQTHGFRAVQNFTWFTFGDKALRLGFVLDPLAAAMLMMIALVGLCIFVFSIGYMADDKSFTRFFAYLSFFSGAMLGLVIANSLLLLFIFWELVGLASYLLIGFWIERPSAAAAAKKAFITTRIGDMGFFLGMLWLYNRSSTLLFYDGGSGCLEGAGLAMLGASATFIALLIFCGAVGKSGQFPLHVWLPDAMEGPTPVSALIHAATMVVAGVYMVARMFPLFVLADDIALDVVTALGLITVLMSATMGLVETDIKRVIAYSTLNSLGLMFVALGSGSVTAAMLYLLVHGFFKALLFLASGSVIHATEKQDIRELGGLAAKMPVTAAAFGIGTLAMISVIPLSGFWAKDEVLHALDQHRNVVLYILALISVFITALYMTRLFIRTFLFEARDRVGWGHAHDAESLMTLPLVLLAALTAVGGLVVFGFVGEALGFPGGFGEFVFFAEPEKFDFAWGVAIFSTALAVGGIVAGWYFWSEKAEPARRAGEALQPVYETLYNRYYIDDAYQWVINRVVLTLGSLVAWFDRNIVNDTAVDGSAGLGLFAGFELKFLETGKLPNYALAIVAGVIGLAVLLLVLRL